MNTVALPKIITVCDTTLCHAELISKLSLSLQQKIVLAQLLAAMGVDVIQVGYPGRSDKQLDELFILSKKLKTATLCGAAGSHLEEIARVAVALKPADRGRINVLTTFHRSRTGSIHQTDLLDQIRESVSLAREYCAEVAWSAIGISGNQMDCLCRSIETAIQSGATTIILTPEATIDPVKLIDLIQQIMHRVTNIEQASVGLNWQYSNLTIDMILSLFPHGISHIEAGMSQLSSYNHPRRDQIGWDSVVQAIHSPKSRTQSHCSYRIHTDLTLLDQAKAILACCHSPGLVSSSKSSPMSNTCPTLCPTLRP